MVSMAVTLEDLLRERPGDPERRAAYKARMLAAVRQHQLRELRAIWRLSSVDPRR